MISIFEELVKKNGSTKDSFLMDRTHLSQKIMPLAIKKIKTAFPSEEIALFNNIAIRKLPWEAQFLLFSLLKNLHNQLFLFSKEKKTYYKNKTIY